MVTLHLTFSQLIRSTMRFSFTVALVVVAHAVETASFAPIALSNRQVHKSAPLFASSEAERLLQRARQLKEEAERETQSLHETLLTGKDLHDQKLDACIDALFPPNAQGESVDAVVARLKNLQYSTDKLLEIVTRLHEREMKAKGIHQVEAYFEHNTHTGFERVSKMDEEEAKRVNGLIDRLIEAAGQIDEEYLKERRTAKKARHLSHVELEHWTVGETAKILTGKIRELRREHDEQFQARLRSFYEAQRKKDLPPPPEYMP
jgi:hypothetical protein